MEAVAQVSRKDPAFTTTFFALPEQVQAWVDRGTLCSETIGPSIVIFRRAGCLLRLYHVAESEPALSKALSSLNHEVTWVADLVGTFQSAAAARCYETHGFTLYASLVRMS